MKDVIRQSIWQGCIAVWAAMVLVSTQKVQAAQFGDDNVIHDVRFLGTDLIDEMTFSWLKSPPLEGITYVTLTDISGPVGLDERFELAVENRLAENLRSHPTVPLRLVHCSLCRRFVVLSNPKSTVMSRGIDRPEVLEELLQQQPDRKGLSLQFEAVGQELILRAQIYRLAGKQEVIWAESFATSASARRILRGSENLLSLAEARAIQDATIKGRDPMELVSRITIRNFLSDEVIPLIFLEQSFEGILLPKRNQRAAFTLGFTSLRDSLEAWSAGGHYAKLLYRDAPHLSQPDLYWFLGFHYVRMRGPVAALFGEEQFDVAQLASLTREPKASLVTWRLGVEAHIKYRFGLNGFLEYVPTIKNNDHFDQDTLLGIPYHAWGLGMVIRW